MQKEIPQIFTSLVCNNRAFWKNCLHVFIIMQHIPIPSNDVDFLARLVGIRLYEVCPYLGITFYLFLTQ